MNVTIMNKYCCLRLAHGYLSRDHKSYSVIMLIWKALHTLRDYLIIASDLKL